MKFIFLLLLILSPQLWATKDVMQTCEKPGLIERLLSDAEKLHEKCIDQVMEENKKEVRAEVKELYTINKKLVRDIRRVALSYSPSNVKCHPQHITRCRQLLEMQRTVVQRIDKLMGWERKIAPISMGSAKAKKLASKDIEKPCPSRGDIEKLRPIAKYHPKIYYVVQKCTAQHQIDDIDFDRTDEIDAATR